MIEIVIIIIEVFLVTLLALGLNLILHELGHLLGGLLSNYKFVFFRIGSYTLLNNQGHICLTRFNVPGTSGQCIMKPPSYDMFQFRLYFSGGILMNGLLVILGVLCVFSSVNIIRLFGFELTYMAVVFLLMNGLPLKIGGIVNDGYHIFKIKDDEIIKLYNQLMIGVLDIEGVSFSRMPNRLFECHMDNTSNFYDAYLILMNALLLVEKQENSQAKEILMRIYKDKQCIDLFKNTSKILLIILTFVEEGKDCDIDQYVDKKLMKFVKTQKYDLSSLLCYYCLLIKEENKKAEDVEKQFLKQKDYVLEKGEVSIFMDLYDKIKKHI